MQGNMIVFQTLKNKDSWMSFTGWYKIKYVISGLEWGTEPYLVANINKNRPRYVQELTAKMRLI